MTPDIRTQMLADLDSAAGVPDWLGAFIRADAAAGRFAGWGLSTVVDENTGGPVIDERLFGELHALAGLPSVWPVGNAGLLHVYGYLLSRVETPYGRKRDRWLDGGVARALGLPAHAFAPWFDAGGSSTPLERIALAAAPIVNAGAGAGVVFRADDSVPDAGGTATGRIAVARTIVVRDAASGATALVYALGEADANGGADAFGAAGAVGAADAVGDLKLVTLFPVEGVDEAWAERLRLEPPRLRYNAVIR